MYQNDRQLYQMALKYIKMGIKNAIIFHCKALQNLPKLGILVRKYMTSGNPVGVWFSPVVAEVGSDMLSNIFEIFLPDFLPKLTDKFQFKHCT
jgi:hypothetical protein